MKIIFLFTISIYLATAQDGQVDPSEFDNLFTRAPEPDNNGATSVGGIDLISNCVCVPYYNCDPDTNTIIEEPNTDGAGLIDIRFGQNRCEHFLDKCCMPDPNKPVQPSTEMPVTPPPTLPPEQHKCGIRNPKGVGFEITGATDREAQFAEFPWMVALLKKNWSPSSGENLAVCGASLIHPQVVLTGAHCVDSNAVNNLKIRAGEWDTQTTKERYPIQERDIREVFIHPQFNPKSVANDIALLVLREPLQLAANVKTVCLPRQSHIFRNNECYASGWGKTSFGKEGTFSVILKKIDLPIVARDKCQTELRKTRLGNRFNLHDSFICAGGIAGKDTCTGDGGSPLVCPDGVTPNRYEQAGIVAWGIGCATTTPGVYVNVAQFRTWIDGIMNRLTFGTGSYTI